MNFARNMSVTKRLFLLSFVSVIGIFMLGFHSISSVLEEKNALLLVKDKTLEAKKIAGLVHELQSERGLTAGVIASNGAKDKIEQLLNQRKNTDKILAEAKNLLPSVFSENLSTKRAAIDSLSISMQDATAYFTNTIATLLEGVTKIPSLISDAEVSSAIQAYTHVTSSKESLGRTRAALNGAFIKDMFAPSAYAGLCVNNGIIECNDHKFALLALPEVLALFNKNKLKEDAVFVKDTIALAISKPEGKFNIDASVWFTKATNVINDYREVEKLFFTKIDVMIDEKLAIIENRLILTGLNLLVIILLVLFFL